MLDVLLERTPATFEGVLADRDVADAMLMRVQVVGENLAKVRLHFPSEFESHGNDSWNRMIAIRNG